MKLEKGLELILTVADIYQRKDYEAISEACGEYEYPQMEKAVSSSQEWPADQKYSKNTWTTHPGGDKRP